MLEEFLGQIEVQGGLKYTHTEKWRLGKNSLTDDFKDVENPQVTFSQLLKNLIESIRQRYLIESSWQRYRKWAHSDVTIHPYRCWYWTFSVWKPNKIATDCGQLFQAPGRFFRKLIENLSFVHTIRFHTLVKSNP